MCAQPVPLAGDGEELAEGECPLSAATVSALFPVRAPGERCSMWSPGLCASWEGVSLRVVPGVFHIPAMKRTTRQNLLFQPLANTHSLAVMLDRLVGCGLMNGRAIHLCYHAQKSLSGVSMLTGTIWHNDAVRNKK